MHASAASARTVLVAIQDDTVRDRFAAALHEAGHRTRSAEEVDTLWTALDSSPNADLILLDLSLSNEAHTLVLGIRARSSSTPLVILSGSVGDAAQVRQLSNLGVSGYVNDHTDHARILPALAPHLFPDSFNRRSSPRVELAVPVSYRVDSTIASAMTLNLARGGLAVRTMSPLEVATRVRARLRLPGNSDDVEAESRVVWRDRRVGGMGLQFEEVSAADQATIDHFVDRQGLAPDGWS